MRAQNNLSSWPAEQETKQILPQNDFKKLGCLMSLRTNRVRMILSAVLERDNNRGFDKFTSVIL
jgi:hypothetical protein